MMKNKGKWIGMLVIVLVFGMLSVSCATYATRGGNETPIGFFTPSFQAEAARPVVGSYFIIAGLFTVGYRDFVRQTDGVEIDIVDSNYLFVFRRVKALQRHTPLADK